MLFITYYHIKSTLIRFIYMGKQKTAAVGSEARHDTADAGKKSSGTLPAKAVPKEASKQSKLHDAKLKSKPDQLASKKPAAGGSEIDDIFGAAKKKATEAKAAEKRKTEEVDKVRSVVREGGGINGMLHVRGPVRTGKVGA